jgi:hypothetical protein
MHFILNIDYHSKEPHVLHFEKYPSQAQQLDFVTHYVNAQVNLQDLPPFDSPQQKEAYLHQFLARVDNFVICSHLVWGLWGIFRAAAEGSQSDFDYIGYSINRFKEYHRRRSLILKF